MIIKSAFCGREGERLGELYYSPASEMVFGLKKVIAKDLRYTRAKELNAVRFVCPSAPWGFRGWADG